MINVELNCDAPSHLHLHMLRRNDELFQHYNQKHFSLKEMSSHGCVTLCEVITERMNFIAIRAGLITTNEASPS